MKNYTDRGGWHLPRLNLIIHSKCFKVLNKLTSLSPRILHVSSKLWRIFTQFEDINRVFADIPQEVDNIHRAICFAYSYFHSVPRVFVRNSAISSSNSRMNVIFLVYSWINILAAAPENEVDRWSIVHATSFPDQYTIDWSNSFPSRYTTESLVNCSHLPNVVNTSGL